MKLLIQLIREILHLSGKSQVISEISGCSNHAIVENVDNAIHEINLCLINNAIGFPNTYPLGTDLSSFYTDKLNHLGMKNSNQFIRLCSERTKVTLTADDLHFFLRIAYLCRGRKGSWKAEKG